MLAVSCPLNFWNAPVISARICIHDLIRVNAIDQASGFGTFRLNARSLYAVRHCRRGLPFSRLNNEYVRLVYMVRQEYEKKTKQIKPDCIDKTVECRVFRVIRVITFDFHRLTRRNTNVVLSTKLFFPCSRTRVLFYARLQTVSPPNSP